MECRCVVQLMLLGYVLVPIFDLDAWWLNLLYTLFMLGVASVEAVSRPPVAYKVRRAHDKWPAACLQCVWHSSTRKASGARLLCQHQAICA